MSKVKFIPHTLIGKRVRLVKDIVFPHGTFPEGLEMRVIDSAGCRGYNLVDDEGNRLNEVTSDRFEVAEVRAGVPAQSNYILEFNLAEALKLAIDYLVERGQGDICLTEGYRMVLAEYRVGNPIVVRHT